MLKKLILSLFFILFISISGYSQDIDSKKHINKIHKEYVEKLNLDKKQSIDFKKILKKYNPLLKKNIALKKKFNDLNEIIKLNDLEVYNILNQSQFAKYKELKLTLEPLKKYRFES